MTRITKWILSSGTARVKKFKAGNTRDGWIWDLFINTFLTSGALLQLPTLNITPLIGSTRKYKCGISADTLVQIIHGSPTHPTGHTPACQACRTTRSISCCGGTCFLFRPWNKKVVPTTTNSRRALLLVIVDGYG